MSEGKRTPPRLDALLAAWPTRERSALDWDDSADRVMSRLSEPASPGVSEEDLLRPPLPATAAEVQSSAAIAPHRANEGAGMTTASRQRDRASFKDLAKMANTPPPSGPVSSGAFFGTVAAGGPQGTVGGEKKDKEENSGVINLAQLAANEQAAAPAAPAATALPPVVPEQMSTLRSVAPPAPAKAPASARPAKAAGAKRGGAWIVVSSMVAAAAVAAGVFFGLQKTQRADAIAMAPAANAPAAPAAAPRAAQTAAAQTVTTPIPPEDRGVDPSSLPPAQAGGATGTSGAVAAHAPLPSVAKPAGAGAAATAAEPQQVAAATPTQAPPAPSAAPAPAGSHSLQDLMQQAAGVTSSPTATAAATSTDAPLPAPGSVPLKPSQGAIQGALGAAMPGARACLGPDDPISHATVTFKSDGSVQSVSISGGAAGKPAEACIRAALSRARVQPFVQPTFTVPATVRPN